MQTSRIPILINRIVNILIEIVVVVVRIIILLILVRSHLRIITGTRRIVVPTTTNNIPRLHQPYHAEVVGIVLRRTPQQIVHKGPIHVLPIHRRTSIPRTSVVWTTDRRRTATVAEKTTIEANPIILMVMFLVNVPVRCNVVSIEGNHPRSTVVVVGSIYYTSILGGSQCLLILILVPQPT